MKKRMRASIQIFSLPLGAWSWLAFALGLCVFLFFQVSLVSEPFQRRALPVEADDAYAYILKSVVLITCPLQDCSALKDLLVQVTPAPEDPEPLAHQKWRRLGRYYPIYHPLYSLGLLALVKLEGTSYEAAYWQLNVLGNLGIALALSVFLISLVGPLAAGVSLASLAPIVLPAKGLSKVVPGSLSLGMGLLMFAYLAYRKGRPGLTFYAMNLLAIGLHPVGLIHTSLAVAFGVACRYPQDQLRGLKGFIPSLALMASYLGLFHLMPSLKTLTAFIPPGTSYVGEVLINFKQLFFYIGAWLSDHGWPLELFFWSKAPVWLFAIAQMLGVGLVIVSLRLREGLGRNTVFLAAVLLLAPALFTLVCAALVLLTLVRGLFDFEPGKHRLQLLALAVLSAGVVVACLFVRYRQPADILTRVYDFWALGAAAVFARGLVLMATAPGLGQILPRYVPASLVNRIPSHPWFWRALLAVFVIFCFLPQLGKAYRHRSNVMQWMIDRYDMSLDVAQPRQVIQRTSPEDVILYERDDTETILPFFLTHGCLTRRAVYLPFLPLPTGSRFDPARVKILVGTNPFLRLSLPLKEYLAQDPVESCTNLKNYLVLPPGATLTLHLDSTFQPEAVEVLNQAGNLAYPSQRLVLIRQASGQIWTRDLSLSPGAWTVCPIPPLTGGSLSFSNPDQKHTVALAGLRLKPEDNSNRQWPWEKITQIVWHHPSSSQLRSFAPPKYTSFQGRTYRLKVLQDGGASVVWELTLMP